MIKPCPRCSSEAKHRIMHNHWHVLVCTGCNAAITGFSEEQVIEKWNMRTELTEDNCPHCGSHGEVKKLCYSGVEAVASYAVSCTGCGCSVADKTEDMAQAKWSNNG